MDERFLCRGKRLDNGEWVQGYIWINETLTHATTYYIADRDGDSHRIDPDTKGHCTGLHDKNGTLIFEGDICKDCDGDRHEIRYDEDGLRWETVSLDYWEIVNLNATWNRRLEIKIIGNIHDNTELLEVQNETRNL